MATARASAAASQKLQIQERAFATVDAVLHQIPRRNPCARARLNRRDRRERIADRRVQEPDEREHEQRGVDRVPASTCVKVPRFRLNPLP